MPMPRQATTQSLAFSFLRLCAFALPFSALFLSTAKAGYPPETEAIRLIELFRRQISQFRVEFSTFLAERGKPFFSNISLTGGLRVEPQSAQNTQRDVASASCP